MKKLLRRLAIMAAPIVLRKIQARRRGGHHRGHQRAARERQPQRLRADSVGRRSSSGAGGTRDLRRRPVLEEVEDREQPREERGCEPERRQL